MFSIIKKNKEKKVAGIASAHYLLNDEKKET